MRYLLLTLFLSTFGCGNSSGSNTIEGQDSESDTGGCEDGDRRCLDDVLQECINGQWADWIYCATFDEICMDIDGEAECSVDTAALQVVDSNCPSGVYDDAAFVFDPSDLLDLEGHMSITGSLWIECPECTDLTPLSCLISVGVDLKIEGNDSLTDLSGLENLSEVEGNFRIHENIALSTLASLSAVTSVGEELSIGGNDTLESVDGLGALETVGGEFNLGGNSALLDVDGLSSLSFVGEGFYVINNRELLDLDGLISLSAVGGEMRVFWNDSLPDCKVCDLLELISDGPDEIEIHDNLDDECTPAPWNCP